MIYKLIDFMREAGRVAVENQKTIDIYEKDNTKETESASDIVTKTDLEISKLFKEYIATNFHDLDYVIVDEERVKELGNDPKEKIQNTEFSFIIDPIDGTHPYSLKMDSYGISVGVFRYGKPYLGIIYCPGIKELIYFDGENTYWSEYAFTENEIKKKLFERPAKYNSLVLEHAWNVIRNGNIDMKRDCSVNFYSAVLSFLYVITGRSKCFLVKAYIWDIAGALPMLKNLGFGFYDYHTKENNVLLEMFDDNLRLKSVKVACQENDLERLLNSFDLVVK